MRLHTKLIVLVAVLSLVGAACHSNSGGGSSPTSAASGTVQKGGTLKIGLTADVSNAYDPQKEYAALSFEFFRCCMLRTLLSFNGENAAGGGDILKPDLATALPEISADGLTYTFHIKPGLDYGPPFQTEEITAQGFINALERESNPQASAQGYAFYYSPIVGFDTAKGGHIPGLSSPDPHTLVIKLSQPTGDFAYRLSMPATAPIPDLPNGQAASTGHVKDYGRFLVPSGPYMFAGTPNLDFSVPADKQKPVSGYVPGRAMTLVRNPSWKDDDLRPANVDEIDVQIGATSVDLANKVDDGEIDFDMSGVPPQSQLQAYEADPTKKAQVHADPSDGTRYLTMNTAVPPFDDVHVRRAVEWVVDKDALRRTRGGPLFGTIAGHFIPPSMLPNAAGVDTYNPYATPNNAGDVTKAKAEMAKSKYDSNHDGICDASACSGILTITDNADPYPAQNAILTASMAKVGLKLDVKSGDRYTFMYDKCLTPGDHAAFCPSIGWFKDYPDALTFGPPTLGAESIGSFDIPMTGASAAQLKQYGYTSAYGVTSVPSFDTQFKKCSAMPIGQPRIDCWFEADKQIMAEAPVVPWLWDNDVTVLGSRVENYSYDQSAGLPALDHLSLANGGQ
jgi:peptide/nickel transport system substrate-binding protein